MSGDANASATARIPRDALENILVRLPASDLRRFRRVCKEWRDIISDPVFIEAHMVQGPTAPTHTIVFVPSAKQQTTNGFLFDERWQLTARFTIAVSEVMIGTCNGLLCFHDRLHKAIKVVEPFTGEVIALPLPTDSTSSRFAQLYCFGFDATARQYKIVHLVGTDDILKVFTVGKDKDWRTMSIPYSSRLDLACNGGAVYWSYGQYADGIPMYARFDLATELIASVKRCPADGLPIFCDHPWWQQRQKFVIRIRWLAGESDDGYWPRNTSTMAFDVVDDMNMPHGRRLPRTNALQRGHLLLHESNGALYAHKIMRRNEHELELGNQKLLLGGGVAEPAKRLRDGQLVSVQGSRQSSTFAYAPTVSPAPLALYLGTATH